MKLNKLQLRNFRKLKDQEVEFAENLNLIEGDNNAGKSSMFYAIYFALTGEAFNFRSPKEYINFNENNMRVKLYFEVDNKEYFVSSEYSQSGGRGDYKICRISDDGTNHVLESTDQGANVNEVKNKVFEITGLDKRTIENVTYAAQQKFIDKVEGGSDQRDAIDYIFDIKTVDVLSNAIKEAIDDKRKEIEKIEDIEEDKKELETEIEDFEEELKEKEEAVKDLKRGD